MKVPKEDFELSSDDKLELGIYLLIKAGGHKKRKRLRSSNCVAFSFSVSLRGVAEVSSPALTSAGPFLWQTFVTRRQSARRNRLLTTPAVPSLHTAQIPNTATFTARQAEAGGEKTDSTRITPIDEWEVDTLNWCLCFMCLWINVYLGIKARISQSKRFIQSTF